MKFFINNQLTDTELRKEICIFAKAVGVNKITFNGTGKTVSGTYNAKKKNMYLNLSQSRQQLLRTFFHELGHHKAASENKWKRYHFNLVATMRTDVVFDIENKIDQIGKQLWHKYVDLKQWGMYKYFYPKSEKQMFINNSSKS